MNKIPNNEEQRTVRTGWVSRLGRFRMMVVALLMIFYGGSHDISTGLIAKGYCVGNEENPNAQKVKEEQKEQGDTDPLSERERLTLFWQMQRAAVRALKVEKDIDKAIGLLKKALVLDPKHEDSLNYFGQGLYVQGKPAEAIAVFERLTQINPASHRGFRQLGFLRARTAKTEADLSLAQLALERAYAIKSEETEVALLLGELHLMQGDFKKAGQRLAAVCRSNPRSVAGFFLQAYISWKSKKHVHARVFLDKAWNAEKWRKRSKGNHADVSVRGQLFTNPTLLSPYFQDWQGNTNKLNLIFQALDQYLNALNFKLGLHSNPLARSGCFLLAGACFKSLFCEHVSQSINKKE